MSISKQDKSRFKLAGTYLAIIMTMSIIFSFILYNVSDHELRGQRRIPVPTTVRLPVFEEFDELRETRLSQSRTHLKEQLLLFNVLTLIGGSAVSYLLAVRALKPIEENLENQARFASDASHELRTPLTAMRSEIEVALRDKKLPAVDARTILESNLEEVTKLEALTSGLLQLARQENSDQAFETIPVERLIEDATARVAAKAKDAGVKLTANKFNTSVYGDRQSLTQLVVILLDNAIKHSPKGSAIEISAKVQKDYLEVIIQDHGSGIDPKDMPHVFERFYRSDKARTKRGEANGYGLGLAIAKQIADTHRGEINIESTLGAGTIVSLKLPINQK